MSYLTSLPQQGFYHLTCLGNKLDPFSINLTITNTYPLYSSYTEEVTSELLNKLKYSFHKNSDNPSLFLKGKKALVYLNFKKYSILLVSSLLKEGKVSDDKPFANLELTFASKVGVINFPLTEKKFKKLKEDIFPKLKKFESRGYIKITSKIKNVSYTILFRTEDVALITVKPTEVEAAASS